MAGLQYSFFPTDFFYPRASPPATSLVAATPNLKITQKRGDSIVVDKTSVSNLSLLIREKTNTHQSRFDTQTWKMKKPLLIEDDMLHF